jgi:hypothetical protein
MAEINTIFSAVRLFRQVNQLLREGVLATEVGARFGLDQVGVAHAYRNVGSKEGIVFNCPNRLYRGRGTKEPVDEIRHEDDPRTPFQLD